MLTKTKTIVVIVAGGVVQDIAGIPPGIEVVVKDYDVDQADTPDPHIKTDGDGDLYFEGTWTEGRLK